LTPQRRRQLRGLHRRRVPAAVIGAVTSKIAAAVITSTIAAVTSTIAASDGGSTIAASDGAFMIAATAVRRAATATERRAATAAEREGLRDQGNNRQANAHQ
jgi:hypothetical protein